MTVVKLPPDGAARRFQAQQENLMAEKRTLMEKGEGNPRDKIRVADAMKSLREHDGWKMLEMWYTTRWSFRNIMQVYRGGDEKQSNTMMIQRELFELIEDTMSQWIEAGDKARIKLAEAEKVSKH